MRFGGAPIWRAPRRKKIPARWPLMAGSPWTAGAVDAALAKGQPVFVDFTAAGALSCKVNERVALETAR